MRKSRDAILHLYEEAFNSFNSSNMFSYTLIDIATPEKFSKTVPFRFLKPDRKCNRSRERYARHCATVILVVFRIFDNCMQFPKITLTDSQKVAIDNVKRCRENDRKIFIESKLNVLAGMGHRIFYRSLLQLAY